MCDAHSWLQEFKPLRADGLAKRPCPYGAGYKTKPLRDAMAQAFASAACR
jgi:endo-1,4-beta-xylanase